MPLRFAARLMRCAVRTGPRCIAAIGLMSCAYPSPAQETSLPENWGGSLAVTSDYRVRGLSQTGGKPALQGGVHARFGQGWMTGLWASTLDRIPGSATELEVDAFVGYAWNIAHDWAGKIVATHYAYPDDPALADYDYDELAVALVYRSQLVATIAWSPNATYFGHNPYEGIPWSAQDGASISYELTGIQPLTPWLALTAGVGYNDLTDLLHAGYWYWNAGVTCSFGALQLDVSRIDSDAVAQRLFGSNMTDAGWSAALSWRF